jgi:hypothetical protein
MGGAGGEYSADRRSSRAELAGKPGELRARRTFYLVVHVAQIHAQAVHVSGDRIGEGLHRVEQDDLRLEGPAELDRVVQRPQRWGGKIDWDENALDHRRRSVAIDGSAAHRRPRPATTLCGTTVA